MGPPVTPDPLRTMKKTGKATVKLQNLPPFLDSTPR